MLDLFKNNHVCGRLIIKDKGIGKVFSNIKIYNETYSQASKKFHSQLVIYVGILLGPLLMYFIQVSNGNVSNSKVSDW